MGQWQHLRAELDDAVSIGDVELILESTPCSTADQAVGLLAEYNRQRHRFWGHEILRDAIDSRTWDDDAAEFHERFDAEMARLHPVARAVLGLICGAVCKRELCDG